MDQHTSPQELKKYDEYWAEYEKLLERIYQLDKENQEIERRNANHTIKLKHLQKRDEENSMTIETEINKLGKLDGFYGFLSAQMEKLVESIQDNESSNLLPLDEIEDTFDSHFNLGNDDISYSPF